jgi:predicted ABC-type ATPase
MKDPTQQDHIVALQEVLAYSPDQPRGDDGKWTAGGEEGEKDWESKGEEAWKRGEEDWKKDSKGRDLPWKEEGDTATYRDSLGIDRKDMPQLSGMVNGTYRPSAEIKPQFVRWLADRGIATTSERVPPTSLKPTQTTGDTPAIERIAAELRTGEMKDTKQITISSDNQVLDGHHNWAGRVLADAEGGHPGLRPGMPVLRVHQPIQELLLSARAFTKEVGLPTRGAGEFTGPHAPKQPADTLEKYTRPDGTLDPARQQLHDNVVHSIVSGHERQEHPEAVFYGGGPASGKSTALTPADDSAIIDPDAIKAMLPEYKQMVAAGDPSAARYVHEESSQIAKEARAAAIKARVNLTMDGTGDSDYRKMAGKVFAAKSAGYTTHAKYVTADTATALERAHRRGEKTGRFIPPTILKETHASVSGVFRQAIQDHIFDQAELWDTNGNRPLKVGQTDTQGNWQVNNQAAWQAFLAKEHEQ